MAVQDGGGHVSGDRGTWELSVPFAPFCRELESALKKQRPFEKA